MKTTTLWAAIVLAPIGAFFFGPQIMEGGSGPCAAAERAAYRTIEPGVRNDNDKSGVGLGALAFIALSDGSTSRQS